MYRWRRKGGWRARLLSETDRVAGSRRSSGWEGDISITPQAQDEFLSPGLNLDPCGTSRGRDLCHLNAGAEPRNSRIEPQPRAADGFVSLVLLSFSSPFNVDFNGLSGSIRLSIFFFFPDGRGRGARADIGVRGLLLIFLTGKRETTILSVNEQPRRNFRSARHCSLLLSRFLLLGILGCIGKIDNFFGRRWRRLPG